MVRVLLHAETGRPRQRPPGAGTGLVERHPPDAIFQHEPVGCDQNAAGQPLHAAYQSETVIAQRVRREAHDGRPRRRAQDRVPAYEHGFAPDDRGAARMDADDRRAFGPEPAHRLPVAIVEGAVEGLVRGKHLVFVHGRHVLPGPGRIARSPARSAGFRNSRASGPSAITSAICAKPMPQASTLSPPMRSRMPPSTTAPTKPIP